MIFSNWVYNSILTGDEGIANFDTLSSTIFNDKLFFEASYKQVMDLIDMGEESLNEVFDSKSLIFDKQKLRETKNLSDEGMKKSMEDGESIFSLFFRKKLAENILFDEDVLPTSYDSIDYDPSSKAQSIPATMVFSLDGDTLDKISNVLNLENTSAVQETIDFLLADEKLQCYSNTLNIISKL